MFATMRSSSRMELDPATVATKADLAALKEESTAAIAAAVAPLATKADLAAAVAGLATKAELAAEVAGLATKAELTAAIAPLPTRDEMHAAIDTAVTREGERTRRHFDVVAERIESYVRLVSEGHSNVDQKIDRVRTDLETQTADPDRRVTRLEARRRKR